ncbi:unnamed protein product [Brassicogethes aeneus]|uniref:UDP-glucuronosyltransferase n=1 Tax=Brassicogethes aeneus TaxID=1431903 RepID=A0A9P0ATY2_BRAAE|nr:unnamed protein product [Brassicogethes aeneus]
MKLCIILFLVNFSAAADILAFMVIPGLSHHRGLSPIFEELAVEGHNVTVVTAFPREKPLKNFNEIDISNFTTMHFDSIRKYIPKPYPEMFQIEIILGLFHTINDVLDKILEVESVRNAIRSKYDVILIENITPLTYVAGIMNRAPIISVCPAPGWLGGHDALGNPTHPVLTPNFLLGIEDNLTFFDRLRSTTFNILWRMLYTYYDLPRCDKIARKHFGENIPSLAEVQKNTSLALFTHNLVANSIKPTVPAVVDINLIHIKAKKPLPNDIKEFMDKSKRGVVYFSLGTYELTYNTTKHRMSIIREALMSLPYDVLWKYHIDEDMPCNIMVKRWFPQHDVLGHPKLKVFVTQRGANSIEEAIYETVPMVILPVQGDQGQNAKKMVSMGMAEMLDIFTMTKKDLTKTITHVAESQKYKDSAIKQSRILKDQPMKGVKKAVWWVEYVLRHNGAPHLRSGFVDMPFYQYYLLDVMGFFLLCFFLIMVVFYKILTYVLSLKKVKSH